MCDWWPITVIISLGLDFLFCKVGMKLSPSRVMLGKDHINETEALHKILLAVKRGSIYKNLGDPVRESDSCFVFWMWWWLFKSVCAETHDKKTLLYDNFLKTSIWFNSFPLEKFYDSHFVEKTTEI